MRKSILKYLLFCSTIFLLQSCDEVNNIYEEVELLSWQSSTRLKVTPEKDKETFIWYKDLLTNQEYWGNETVDLNMNLKSNVSADQFSKVDFYITVEEKDGYNYTAPFNTTGKMLTSVDIPETGEFSLSISATDAYGLFINDFHNDRSTKLPIADDIFLVYWVITAKDGSTLDSRSESTNDRYSFKVRVEDYAPPVWAGTFNYEWIEASGGAVTWGKVFVGQTGTVTITNLGEGKYSMTNLLWNYNYGTGGTLSFDFLTGLTSVSGGAEERWYISNINGTSMDIRFWYKYSDAYDETGTVRFTRTDGVDWPTNIYTNDN